MILSYRRVSTDEQHNGPEAQADAIKRWQAAHFPEEQHIWDYFDNGVSGATPLRKRRYGAEMLIALEVQPQEKIVVVSKLDRLFRSVADAATTIDSWTRRGIKLVSIQEGFDLTSPYGLAMAQMASVFAQLEREMISRRTKDALEAKRRRGEALGSIPYGWDVANEYGANGIVRAGVLVPNWKEQEVIREICRANERGQSTRAIANFLNAGGIPTKQGRIWGKNHVQRVIDRAKKYGIIKKDGNN